MTIPFLVTKSLFQDIDFLHIKHLPLPTRLSFLFQKYLALATLCVRNSARITLPQQTYRVTNYSDIGTLQSNILDFYNNIACFNLITSSHPTFIDVGGHVGQSCAAMKLFFPTATIYSFEADPDTFDQLQENSHALSNTTIYNIGIGDQNKTRTFYRHLFSGMSSFKKYVDHTYTAQDEIQIEMKKLDDVLTTRESIDILKMDIEGLELEGLRGGVRILQQAKYLIVEIGLRLETRKASNMELLSFIFETCSQAKIIKIGRPLGIDQDGFPMCQDIVIQLR